MNSLLSYQSWPNELLLLSLASQYIAGREFFSLRKSKSARIKEIVRESDQANLASTGEDARASINNLEPGAGAEVGKREG